MPPLTRRSDPMKNRPKRRPFLLLPALLALAAPLAAQQPTAVAPETRTIRVTGTGEVQAMPDQAQISFAVETFAPTARAASERNARIMEQVIRALVAAGVPRDAIDTRNFSVFPEYTEPRPEPLPRADSASGPRIRGYRVNNTVVLETPRLDRVGQLIDVALGAGANRVDGVSFSLQNAAPVQAEALRQATARARETAQTLAGALGVRLGAILDASTAAQPPRFETAQFARVRDFGGVALQGTPPPIQPGEQTVYATVSLVFEIEGQR